MRQKAQRPSKGSCHSCFLSEFATRLGTESGQSLSTNSDRPYCMNERRLSGLEAGSLNGGHYGAKQIRELVYPLMIIAL